MDIRKETEFETTNEKETFQNIGQQQPQFLQTFGRKRKKNIFRLEKRLISMENQLPFFLQGGRLLVL